jgi:hypothetical protein
MKKLMIVIFLLNSLSVFAGNCPPKWQCNDIGTKYNYQGIELNVEPGETELIAPEGEFLNNSKVKLTLTEDVNLKYWTDGKIRNRNLPDYIQDYDKREITFKKGTVIEIDQSNTIKGYLKHDSILYFSSNGDTVKVKVLTTVGAMVAIYSNQMLKYIDLGDRFSDVSLRNGQVVRVSVMLSLHRNGVFSSFAETYDCGNFENGNKGSSIAKLSVGMGQSLIS